MPELSGYELSRDWFEFSFENPDLINPNHTALYFFAIEHCNRLGWKPKFGLPTQMAMDAIGIKNWRTYSRAFNDLVDWGFLKLHQKSKNQYSATVIAIVKNTKAHTKAYTKATQKHLQKHSKSIAVINKPNNLITYKPNNMSEKISDGQKKDFIDSIINEFKEAYETANNIPYEIIAPGKEKGLAGKLLGLYKKKNPDANSEKALQDLRRYFDMCVRIEDNFLNENMSLGIIISQFNKINKILRHGKSRGSKGTSDAELAEIIARNFGSDYPGEKGG